MSADHRNKRNYYCSQKFRFLKIDLESMTTLNCHAAASHPVDFEWLAANPGKLFNNERSVAERHMMLLNQRNSSCEQNCWTAEDRGAVSPRMCGNGSKKTHTQVRTQPETIDLTIGSNCNLTCSYCCKEYSSAWRNDIIDNGDYTEVGNVDRFSITSKDWVLSKLSQREIKSSKKYNILLDEIKLSAPTLQRLVVTGGEPLLDNHLLLTITKLDLLPTAVVEMYTGLGVSKSRFIKIVEKLRLIPNLLLKVSAESTGANFEFNRYGNKWKEVLDKLKILKDMGISVEFHSSLSNLTLMGFVEFYQFFSKDYKISVSFVNHPVMMAAHVLDQDTKSCIKKSLEDFPEFVSAPILASMQAMPSDEERLWLKQFLTQFMQRRPQLNINVYPESFVNWIGS